METQEEDVSKSEGPLALNGHQSQNAEAEGDKLANDTNRQQSRLEEKRQLEKRISDLEVLENKHTENLTQAKNMARKSMNAMKKMTTDLDAVSLKLVDQRQEFERENKEMRNKLELIHTIANLEEQLEQEARENAALRSDKIKLDTRVKELQTQVDDERRNADQYKEQLEKLNNSVKILKKQMDKAAEEEVARINEQKRTVQQDLVDQMKQTEILLRE